MEDTQKTRKKPWYKTIWGMLVLLAVWPISLSYWIYKNNKLLKPVKIVSISLIWLLVFIVTIVQGSTTKGNLNSASEVKIAQGQKTESSKSTALPATSAPTPSPVVVPTPFDKKLGNNDLAASLAQQTLDVGNKVKPGVILAVNVSLGPDELPGQTRQEYIQTIRAAILSIEFDSSFWNSIDQDNQKYLLTTFVKDTFSFLPPQYVGINATINTPTSQMQLVATGKYDIRTDKADITFY